MEHFDAKELQQQLIRHLTSITSEAQANKVLARMQTLDEASFHDLRLTHRAEVSQLVRELCDLLPLPLHKSQSLVRHASDDIRFLLFDRFTSASNFIGELAADHPVSLEFDTVAQALDYFLIEWFEGKLLSGSPPVPPSDQA